MTTLFLIFLCSLVHWCSAHVVYSKEMTRSRHGPEEWRPVVDKYATVFRYPIYHKGHFNPGLNKKTYPRQTAEHSENVEVFSPAPPSILGSFSVFGHATLNGREHAGHITKKSPRPQPQLHTLRYQHPYEQPSYFYEASLRPPLREHLPDILGRPHSASLAPNSYYFEQPQAFRSPTSELTYLKVKKPIVKPHGPVYRPSGPLNPFHLSTPGPLRYESAAPDLYDAKTPKLPASGRPVELHFDRNPFGYTARRPETVTETTNEEGVHAEDVFRELSHLGRPFQSSSSFSQAPAVRTKEEFQNYRSYATIYPIGPIGDNVKFSGRPFQIPSSYGVGTVHSSVQPDYYVTRRPYTKDSYAVTATTIVSPTLGVEQSPKEIYTETSFVPSTGPEPQFIFGKDKDTGFKPSVQIPEVHITSDQGYNSDSPSPFLPTPSTDTEPFVAHPTVAEETTPYPIHFNEISKKQKVSTNSDHAPPTEYFNGEVTNTEVTEVTTGRSNPLKTHRRPVRPTEASTVTNENNNDNTKNHKVKDDGPINTNYEKNRRRKPYDHHSRGGVFGTKTRHSEFKRYQTTTSTTSEPHTFETTQYPADDYTAVSDSMGPHTVSQFESEVESEKPEEDYYRSTESTSYSGPNNDVQLYGNERFNNLYEVSPTIPPTTNAPNTVLTTTTTQLPTTDPPVSSISLSTTRSRNKYGSNRPRFSVKDYRERLNRLTSTTTTTPSQKTEDVKKLETPKYSTRIRGSSQFKTSNNGTDVTETKQRKYKPRVGPSRYKFSTSMPTTTVPTSERTNAFRPSTNRYKSGTGKYYSRYRTSSPAVKNGDRTELTTLGTPTRPKGVFSAKRRPFPLKTRTENKEDSKPETTFHSATDAPSLTATVKTVENEIYPPSTKKIDDTAASETTSVENLSFESELSDPTGAEATRVADLTSSSSNEFESSGFLVGISSTGRRTVPKIMISTEDPILPLEAFFQTQNKRDKK